MALLLKMVAFPARGPVPSDPKQAAFQTLGFARRRGGLKVWAVGLAVMM